MLSELQLRQFVTIDAATLSFKTGFTCITGETGAGKSVVINALEQLQGARLNKKLIRSGAKRAEIQALFNLSGNTDALNWLKAQQLEPELEDNNNCLVRRILAQDQSSCIYINGRRVTLSQLQAFSKHCLQIQGQHQSHNLRETNTQRVLLDVFSNQPTLLQNVKTSFHQHQQITTELEQLKITLATQQAEQALLTYQIEELNELDLSVDEAAELELQFKTLHSQTDLRTQCAQSEQLINQDGNNLLAQLEQLATQLSKTSYQVQAEQIFNCSEQLKINLTEIQTQIETVNSQLETDPKALAKLEKRLEQIHQIAGKHKVKTTDLYQTWQDLLQKQQGFSNQEDKISQLEQAQVQAQQHYQSAAQALSKARTKAAKQLSSRATELVQTLELPKASLTIQVTPQLESDSNKLVLSAAGSDQISIQVQTNPGLAPGSLEAIASGGELSRIALALQVVLVQALPSSSLIFDEVDTGVSGKTATRIGALLRQLAQKTQVLCITHLAQVAALADQHIKVNKSYEQRNSSKTTFSQFYTLSNEERVQELARILGGAELSDTALAHAKALLQP